jgi:hypothetical protein
MLNSPHSVHQISKNKKKKSTNRVHHQLKVTLHNLNANVEQPRIIEHITC